MRSGECWSGGWRSWAERAPWRSAASSRERRRSRTPPPAGAGGDLESGSRRTPFRPLAAPRWTVGTVRFDRMSIAMASGPRGCSRSEKLTGGLMKLIVAYIDGAEFEPFREEMVGLGIPTLSVAEAGGALPAPTTAG